MSMINTLDSRLPEELLWEVISFAWASDLSNNERIQFMTSSLLVCRAWMRIFIALSFTDVHIPCYSFIEQYMRIICRASQIFANFSIAPEILCRSITVKVSADKMEQSNGNAHVETRMGKTVSDMLYKVKGLGSFTNLRTIIIQYVDMGYDDLFRWHRLIDLPPQVENLVLEYTFTPWIIPCLINDIGSRRHIFTQGRNFSDWNFPSLRRLYVKGGTDILVSDLISTCPHLDVLEVNNHSSKPFVRFTSPMEDARNHRTSLQNISLGV